MKAVLIYNIGEGEDIIKVEEFDSEELMIAFINGNKRVGKGIIAAYRCYNKIEIEPFEKVINYRVKE